MNALRTSFEYGALGGTSGLRVLVADDDPPNRRLFDALFGSCGSSVTLAQDGAEALTLALGQDFDLICLDRHMPHLTGDEVAGRVRAARKDGPRPFLVLCTSDLHPYDASDHFDLALSKPIRLQEIVNAVAEALQFRVAWRDYRADERSEPLGVCRQAGRKAVRYPFIEPSGPGRRGVGVQPEPLARRLQMRHA